MSLALKRFEPYLLCSLKWRSFFVFGVTRLGSKLVDIIPNSLKAGVIIGAGIEALMGELKVGGLRLTLPLQNVMRWGESRWNLFIAVEVLFGLLA